MQLFDRDPADMWLGRQGLQPIVIQINRLQQCLVRIGNSNRLFPDGRRYSHPEQKSSAVKRAQFGEDSPLSMRIHPLS